MTILQAFRKSTFRLGFIIICISLLASCAQGDAHLTIHRNGTADLDLGMSVSNRTLAMIGKPQLMKEISDRLQESGLHVESYNKDGQSGFSANRLIHLQEKDRELQLPDGIKVEQLSTKKFFYTKQHVIISYDLEQLVAKGGGDLAQKVVDMSPLVKGLLQNQVQFKFLLTAPIKLGDNNANEIQDGGRTLVWNVELFDPHQIEVSLNIPNVRNIVCTAGGAFILILLLVWFGFRIRRRRGKNHNLQQP